MLNIVKSAFGGNKFLGIFVLVVLLGSAAFGANYAVIIQGSSPDKGMAAKGTITYGEKGYMNEFWQDPLLLYQALENAGVAEENMFVLWGDGTDWGYNDTSYQPRYRVKYVDMDASLKSVDSIANYLAKVLTDEDILFVYTFDHGWFKHICLRDGDISDTAFARLFNQIPCKYRWIGMQQCESGGFINVLQNEKTVMMTSTDSMNSAYRADNVFRPGEGVIQGSENEIYNGNAYNHGEWNMHLLTGFQGGLLPSLYIPEPIFRDSIDTDRNGKISLLEIQTWINKRDSWTGWETPQFSDLGGLAANFYVYPQIEVQTAVEEKTIQPKELIRVFPNPSFGEIKFVSNAEKPVAITIYDVTGRVVTNMQAGTVTLKSGIYFYRVKLNGKEIGSGKLTVLR